MHNASKVLMGAVTSSGEGSTEVFQSDPAVYLAGLAVRRASSGLLSLAKASGRWVGISKGKSLSDDLKTDVLKDGFGVPVLLSRQPARGSIEITSYANLVSGTDDSVTVGATVFTAQTGAVTLGQTTFRAATSNDATAISLAAQINAHATAGGLVVAAIDPDNSANVLITAKSNTTSGDTIALAYTDNDSNVGATVSGATLTDSDDTPDYVEIGANVYFSDDTGKADDPSSGATVSNAVYRSAPITGIAEDGTEVLAALVDFQGGL